ncbi:PQQ-dependent sugar dehydrogenase [Natronosalvus vescus]|uniref:PQQ-dependent sugar dehydrogenase n=1 Tax=Natronosalvus vescus TaxID=2953881 RepID=UPI002091A164|nr:PQQ-dependent sugar dehydrogenase [Natronosalvus vescus]
MTDKHVPLQSPTLDGTSRRLFLKLTGAAGVMAGLGGLATAQEETAIELGGVTSGWEGRAPPEIEGETNPTLSLEPGETYTITWENVDGLPHDIIILDAEGEEIVGTEIMDDQGETQTLEFEATEEMSEYYCSVHPTTMRGDIQIGDAEDDEAEDEAADEETDVVGEGPTVGLERVADGFVSPVGFEVAPGEDDRYYVLDQPGQLYVVDGDGGDPQEFVDLSDRMVEVGDATGGGFDERGLLGVAFHPDYQENRRLFVYYSAPLRDEPATDDDDTDDEYESDDAADENGDDNETEANGEDNENGENDEEEGYDHTGVLAEFTATEDFESVDPDSEVTILEVPQPQFNHNGGPLIFGPDGYLYWALGDGGGADDIGFGHVEDWYDENEGGNGQDTTDNLLGSILRIDVDVEGENGEPYGIPEDNPFVDSDDGLDEYFAWGLRNPWRASFDDEGRFFVADVGQVLFEEVNIVENGGNYGWNVREGIECFSTDTPDDPPEECPTTTPEDVRGGEELIDPIIHYPQRVDGEILGIAVIGGYVYDNDTVPELQDHYVFGDWSDAFEAPSGTVFASPTEEYEPMAGRTEDDLWEIDRLSVANAPGGELHRFILSFGQDHDGELYVLTTARYTDGETGEVFRIVAEEDGEEIEPPENPIGVDDEEEEDREEEVDEEEVEDEEEEADETEDTDTETDEDEESNDDGTESDESTETESDTDTNDEDSE